MQRLGRATVGCWAGWRLIAVLLPLAIGGHASAGDEARFMTAAQIQQTFPGQRVIGVYPDDSTFNEAYHVDGRVAYSEETGKVLTGRWSVVGDTFCTFYDDGQGGACFSIRRESGNCYAFHAAAEDEKQAVEDPDPNEDWDAKASLVGRPSTCRTGQLVSN